MQRGHASASGKSSCGFAAPTEDCRGHPVRKPSDSFASDLLHIGNSFTVRFVLNDGTHYVDITSSGNRSAGRDELWSIDLPFGESS
jgi:hypothetical protein